MQATLSASALKPFTRALTCLSRYGDDLVIHADAEYLSLSTTNSSLSAYCRFKYSTRFFSKYRVGNGVNGVQGSSTSVTGDDVKGQLLAKTLLSILKHRTIDKAVERCELSILEGRPQSEDELDDDRDSLESRLIIKLHCKLGIVKTHRLALLIPNSLLSPGVPDSQNESHLTIGPRAVRDITEHFPSGRSMKSDPQLVWTFGETDVDVKSLESSLDTKGRTQLATELTISADEFDVYEIFSAPVTIAFHLREFNATIAFAEATGSALDLRFTDPAAPLFIGVEGDESEYLFVISTSQIQGSTNTHPQINPRVNTRKRTLHDVPVDEQQASTASGSRQLSEHPREDKVRKSMRAALRTDATPGPSSSGGIATSQAGSRSDGDFDYAPPSFVPVPGPSNVSQQHCSLDDFHPVPADLGRVGDTYFDVNMEADGPSPDIDYSGSGKKPAEPLFYPGSPTTPRPSHPNRARQSYTLSQLPRVREQTARELSPGGEYTTEEGLNAILEGEEAGLGVLTQGVEGRSSLELFEDEFGPTQEGDCEGRKTFQPLFED